ncbi:MAG: glycosyltransferase family 2 protein [Kiritimatiellae bacterium]|nr:glycosyltransferase family 2 protein [Kiritimatiellia bacterium]
MKTTLLMPTWNEADGMKEIMPRIQRDWVDEIMVVDAGSTDGTLEYARDHGYRIVQQQRPGLKHAYMEAMKQITNDVVITFSPDGNSDPDRLPDLTAKMRAGYDMVIVSRYAAGARSEDDDAVTAFGNKLFTTMINLLYRARYTDTLVMYRAYRREIFTALDMDKKDGFAERVVYNRASTEPLLCIRAAKMGLRCADIPGDEPPRIGGKRKLQVFRGGAAILCMILRELVVWRRRGKAKTEA